MIEKISNLKLRKGRNRDNTIINGKEKAAKGLNSKYFCRLQAKQSMSKNNPEENNTITKNPTRL